MAQPPIRILFVCHGNICRSTVAEFVLKDMVARRGMLGCDPKGKLFKMLEFAGNSRDVADPWYTGDFDTTYEDVCDGCEGLLNYLAPRM